MGGAGKNEVSRGRLQQIQMRHLGGGQSKEKVEFGGVENSSGNYTEGMKKSLSAAEGCGV